MFSSNDGSIGAFEPSNININNYTEIAKTITSIQNNSKKHWEAISEYRLGNRKPLTIGVTGAAGVGKSTFINKFTEIALHNKKRVAILAIDPTSKFSTGSFLGDRLSFNGNFPEKGVFIRSIASPLDANSIPLSLSVIIKFLIIVGYDLIIVETLGVGQSDVEINNFVDIVIVIPSHESIGWVQQMKSSHHDIADYYFINKCDVININATYNSLKSLFGMKMSKRTFQDSVAVGSAKSGDGIEEFYNRVITNSEIADHE